MLRWLAAEGRAASGENIQDGGAANNASSAQTPPPLSSVFPSLATTKALGSGGGISVGKLGEERGIQELSSKQRFVGILQRDFLKFLQGMI